MESLDLLHFYYHSLFFVTLFQSPILFVGDWGKPGISNTRQALSLTRELYQCVLFPLHQIAKLKSILFVDSSIAMAYINLQHDSKTLWHMI